MHTFPHLKATLTSFSLDKTIERVCSITCLEEEEEEEEEEEGGRRRRRRKEVASVIIKKTYTISTH